MRLTEVSRNPRRTTAGAAVSLSSPSSSPSSCFSGGGTWTRTCVCRERNGYLEISAQPVHHTAGNSPFFFSFSSTSGRNRREEGEWEGGGCRLMEAEKEKRGFCRDLGIDDAQTLARDAKQYEGHW